MILSTMTIYAKNLTKKSRQKIFFLQNCRHDFISFCNAFETAESCRCAFRRLFVRSVTFDGFEL